jgi:hypothetical protein
VRSRPKRATRYRYYEPRYERPSSFADTFFGR